MAAGRDLDRYCTAHAARFERELVDFLRIPSISTEPARSGDVRRCAEWLRAAALRSGFTRAELLETAGHPAVYAERIVDPRLPTVLVYGHYDVQPEGDRSLWASPPFEPSIRDGRIHARGATDDKGQLYVCLKALEAALATGGDLPVNLKLIAEGEEEVGSAHFDEVVARERARLAADAVLVSDTPMVAAGTPTITTALRGLVALRVTVTTGTRELHSGQYGGAVPNAAEVLLRILATLKDPVTGRVTVPGFYADADVPSAAERAAVRELAPDDAALAAQAGVSATPGEAGWTAAERIALRPSLEINAFHAGYRGDGFKTSIPDVASAGVSCRLVAHQDPERIAALVRRALEAAAPAGARVEVRTFSAAPAVVTPSGSAAVRAAADALRSVYGSATALNRSGGSIPAVTALQRVLGAPVVMIGLGNPDDGMHGPNEKIERAEYHRGIRAIAAVLAAEARMLRRSGRELGAA